jgi:hypothetical protein
MRLRRPARRHLLVYASLIAIPALSGMAYLLLDEEAADRQQDPLYASFLFLDGSREWAPIDIGRSIETIEAFQEMENDGLKNMILELDKNPQSSPTEEELERLWQLYRASFESASKHGWFEYASAMEDGFYQDPNDPYHYPHGKYPTDGRELVPDEPEFLMYYPDPDHPGELILAGFMYQQSGFDHHGEQIAGSLTRWHKHIYGAPVCFDQNLVPHGKHVEGSCAGAKSSESPEMLHVWFIDHPESQFASGMSLETDLIETPRMISREDFMRKHREAWGTH